MLLTKEKVGKPRSPPSPHFSSRQPQEGPGFQISRLQAVLSSPVTPALQEATLSSLTALQFPPASGRAGLLDFPPPGGT